MFSSLEVEVRFGVLVELLVLQFSVVLLVVDRLRLVAVSEVPEGGLPEKAEGLAGG